MSGKHVCPFMQLDASYGNYHAWYAPASPLPSSSSLPFRFSALPFSPSLARLCDRRMTELKDNDGKSFTMADYLKIAKRLQGVGAEELNTFSKQVRSLSVSRSVALRFRRSILRSSPALDRASAPSAAGFTDCS